MNLVSVRASGGNAAGGASHLSPVNLNFMRDSSEGAKA